MAPWRWWRLLFGLVVIAGLSIARLPVPCQGDSEGHPCNVEACACVASCSCHVAHAKDVPLCCQVPGAEQADPAVASGFGLPKHMSLPATRWFAVPAAWPTWPRLVAAEARPPSTGDVRRVPDAPVFAIEKVPKRG